MTATRSLRQLFIVLFLFVLVLGWALVQMNERFVNDKGWASDWFNPQTWLMPMSNHPPLGQAGVNLDRLNDVYFIDSQHGWAVDENGDILATDNAGQTWHTQTSGITTPLTSVQFIDSQHGWIVGSYGVILVTDNAGQTWQPQSSGVTNWFYSVHFIDSQHGWAVGNQGVILTTNNAGQTWHTQTSGITTSLNSVQFSDSQHGWAAGNDGVILATDNAGKTWHAQSSGSTTWFNSVQFSDNLHSWVVGGEGVILATDNAGQTWHAQTSGITTMLRSVHFSDSQHGWAAGNDGVILATDNAGKTWHAQSSGSTTWFNSVHFSDSQHGWAAGTDGVILATDNAGQTWHAKSSGVTTILFSVQFIDNQHGWAVGDNGVILTTNNAGQTWHAQSSGVTTILLSVQFIDNQHGWAVGHDGVILTTNNAGQTWHAQTSGVTMPLYSVHFIDSQHGWAVGYDGVILTTNNAGQTWHAQTSGVTMPLYSVQFIDSQHGWVVGDGVILATNNAGQTWNTQANSNSIVRLKSVQFIDSQHGWVVGDGGVILATDNAGQTWYQQTSGVTNWLSSVRFSDSQHGWAVGDNGVILTTGNAGQTWYSQASGVTNLLHSVQFSDSQHGWAVGHDGVVLTTDNGGATWKNSSPYPKVFGEGHAKLAIFPSPLVWLLLLLSGSLLFRRVYSHWATPRSLQGGISDAPIDSAEDDRLGRLELVKTLADLIRNRDTVPPLAIAITAPWGSGKSSMLGLLREELKGEVFTVQLNAWHYRDDGQLLAALMEHIREQALPPLLSLDNLLFRARLLQQRWFSGVGLRTFMVLLVAVIAAVFFARQQDWQLLSDWLSQGQKSLELPTWLQSSVDLPWFQPISVLLAGLVLYRILKIGYESFHKSLDAFSPELVAFATKLGKSTREAVQVADWAKDAGLRFRFAKDFEEVANALGKGRLLLLIDDLDRCEPKQIETVMSTLNFLFSSSAPCYAVLAMDWGYVTDALGSAFKEMAVARDVNDVKGKAFAGRYVEKIVQISIDLPAVDGSRVALVDNSQPRSTAVVNWWEKLEHFWVFIRHLPISKLLRYTGMAALCLLVMFFWRDLEALLWFCWQQLKSLNNEILAFLLILSVVVLLVCNYSPPKLQLSLLL